MELHVNCGHTPARHLKRVLVDSDAKNMRLENRVDEVLGQCEIRRESDKAPQPPTAGSSPDRGQLNGKLRLWAAFFGRRDCIARAGLLRRVLSPVPSPLRKPPTGMGRFLQLADCHFW